MNRAIIAALILAPFAANAQDIPRISATDAYALIRNTMLAFDADGQDTADRMKSAPDGMWDAVTPSRPSILADDPWQWRFLGTEDIPDIPASRTSRMVHCERVSFAGIDAFLNPNGTSDTSAKMVFGALTASSAYATFQIEVPEDAQVMLSCFFKIAIDSDPQDLDTLLALLNTDFDKVGAPERNSNGNPAAPVTERGTRIWPRDRYENRIEASLSDHTDDSANALLTNLSISYLSERARTRPSLTEQRGYFSNSSGTRHPFVNRGGTYLWVSATSFLLALP